MSNSALAEYVLISPNNGGKRTTKIDRITPHCVVGQVSIETLGEWFHSTDIEASSNYGIDTDGRIGIFVPEDSRSWCSSNKANDDRAVTIECASDTEYPYTMNEAVWSTLITLCTDICVRNGKKKLLWFGDKNKTLNYVPKDDEMVMTVHRWFDRKECPGDWLYNRLGQLAELVTHSLSDLSTITATNRTVPFKVQVLVDDLNYRIAGSFNAKALGVTGKGIFTIVSVTPNGWGKLKSGAGWIYIENSNLVKILEENDKQLVLTQAQKDRISKKLETRWWNNYTSMAKKVIDGVISANVKERVEELGFDYDIVKIIVDEIKDEI